MDKYLEALGSGIVAGISAAASLESILDYTNIKSAVLQAQLAKAPEITQQTYDTAVAVATNMAPAGEYLIYGVCLAAGAGLMAVRAITAYYVKDEECEEI